MVSVGVCSAQQDTPQAKAKQFSEQIFRAFDDEDDGDRQLEKIGYEMTEYLIELNKNQKAVFADYFEKYFYKYSEDYGYDKEFADEFLLNIEQALKAEGIL